MVKFSKFIYAKKCPVARQITFYPTTRITITKTQTSYGHNYVQVVLTDLSKYHVTYSISNRKNIPSLAFGVLKTVTL